MYRLKPALFLTVLAVAALGQNAPAPKPSTPVPTTPTPVPGVPSLRGKLNLKSPNLGAPGSRVDAATRGDGDEISSLYVLAPETIGLTSRAEPSLYWYQTKPTKLPFEFALLKPGEAKPVLAIRMPDGLRAGFQRIRLADHGVSLEPGVDYQYVVALVRDPKSRSRDILSSGWIRRQPGLSEDQAWYDKIESLSDRISQAPLNLRLRTQRSTMLRQAGLLVPASVDAAP